MNITTATPTDIDTVLFRAWEDESHARSSAALRRDAAATTDSAVAARHYTEDAERYDEEARTARAAAAPLEAEYERRGGWTRAFLVANNNGHIHRTTGCTTTYITTRWAYLPEVSGMDDEQIVNLAGERACTVCYPDAPVAVLAQPTRLFSADERDAQAERDARAQAKAGREAKRRAAAIREDGEPLRYRSRGYTETVKTITAAKSALTDEFTYTPDEDAVRVLSEALAARLGTTPAEQVEAAKKRNAKRR